MRNILFLLGFVFLSNTCLTGQSSNYKKIDQYLQDYQNKIPIPGFSIAIVENNQTTFSKGYGVEIQGKANKMNPNSSLGIGALGRAFTTVGIMQLVEQGKINLDRPVVDYLPWFKTANKNFSDEITVRMCLSHTTAIPAQSEAVASLDPDQSLAQFVRSMEGFYVKRKPGLSYEDSAEGYSIAGLIISELSGLSYTQYLQKNIFIPLKMNRTTTDYRRFDALQVLYGHEMGLKDCLPAKRGSIDGNYFPSGSELKSSANDFANFMNMLLNEGKFQGQTFLTTESIQEIFKSNVSFQGLGTMLGGNGIDIHCGLGWLEMNIENREIFIQVGNTGTAAAIAGLSRDRNQGVILLFNGDVNRLDRYVYPTLENTVNNVIHILNNEATTDFAVMRFDDPFEDEDYELPKDQWAKYLGDYRSFGEESAFFKDIDIQIYETENGQIELKSYNEQTLKGHYILQFTSPSRAALRNISHPREIQFKIFPNGTIGGLFMFGTEFKKQDKSLTGRFKRNSAPDQSVSFSFLNTAIQNWAGNHFSATFPDKENVHFDLVVTDLESQTFDDFVQQKIGNQTILTQGHILKKNLKGGIWTERTIYVKDNTTTTQLLFVFYQDPVSQKQVQLTLSNPYGKFTSDLQEVMMYFFESVSF